MLSLNISAIRCPRPRCCLSAMKTWLIPMESYPIHNQLMCRLKSTIPVHRGHFTGHRGVYKNSNEISLIRHTTPRNFHTSQPKKAVPLLAVLLKPITKGLAIISGRAFRQWWKGLPKEKRKHFLEVLKRNKYRILSAIGASGCIVGIFYISHLQTTPITNRKRVIFFSESQFAKIAEAEYEQQCRQYEHRFIDSNELFRLVDQVASQLIKCNQHLPEIKNRTWVVHIVDDPTQKNAFVLPNGHIFVFTGMLLAVMNEHQLGIVLAHEIAHVVLNHGAEQASFLEFFDWLMIVVLAGFWAFLPNDGLAIIATWFKNRVAELLIQMPYSRSLEVEADVVGLELAANSCFDVRESQVFWELMANASQRNDEVQMEWLSTHPTHEHRAKHLEELIPKAIKMREFCNCPALPKEDPRLLLKSLKAQQDEISKEPRTVVVPGVVINASKA